LLTTDLGSLTDDLKELARTTRIINITIVVIYVILTIMMVPCICILKSSIPFNLSMGAIMFISWVSLLVVGAMVTHVARVGP